MTDSQTNIYTTLNFHITYTYSYTYNRHAFLTIAILCYPMLRFTVIGLFLGLTGPPCVLS